MKRVQVQIDLQFEVDPKVEFDARAIISPEAALRYAAELKAAIVKEVVCEVSRVLSGGGSPAAFHGYARIKGAVEERKMWGALKEDWLEVDDE